MEHGDYINQGQGLPQPLTSFPITLPISDATLARPLDATRQFPNAW